MRRAVIHFVSSAKTTAVAARNMSTSSLVRTNLIHSIKAAFWAVSVTRLMYFKLPENIQRLQILNLHVEQVVKNGTVSVIQCVNVIIISFIMANKSKCSLFLFTFFQQREITPSFTVIFRPFISRNHFPIY